MGNPKGQSTSTTTSGPPGPVMDDYYSAISRAQQVASTPYQAYQGNLVQGFSPDQLAAFQNVNNAQTAWQPYVNQAQQYATLGASPIQASAIANYSNPYQQQVVNATLGNIDETNQQQQAQLIGNNLGSGGLFNDRLGVAQGELARQQGLANNQTLAGLNQSNYTQALGAAQADRSAAGQAAYTFGNLGSESLQNILQGSQAQLGTGGLQQQLGQAQLNVPYMQFQQQQAFPYQQTGWLAGIETGIGSNLGGNSTTVGTPAQPNPYAQYAGLGIAGLGAAGNLGWAPFAARGGRIHGYADGGAPDGLSIPFGSAVPGMGGGQTPAIPYGGAMTYIPGGSQITRGSGPPGAPKGGGGAPAAATANPFADDIKALGSLGSHFKQPSDPGIQTGGASLGISPEQYATASDLGVSSLGNPDEGFYARGGPIKGDPRGIYVPRYARGGYAEGGAPDLGSPFNPEISPVLWPDSGSDSEAFSPRSLGEVAPAAIGPMPGPGAAPWGDLASAPIDASSFAKPSWAAALGASAAPSGPTGLSAGAYTSQETGQGFDVPPVAGQASLGAARSWPDNAVATGPGMAPPLEDKGSVATPPGGASAGPAGLAPSFVSAIQQSEGFEPRAKWDYRQYTNGYGTKAQHPGEVIDEATARKRFDAEIGSAAKTVDGVNPNLDPGTRAALTSLTFNAGDSWVRGKLGEQIRAGDLDGARKTFEEYNKAGGRTLPGLADRRAQEASWFGKGDVPSGPAMADRGPRTLGDAALPPTARAAEASLGTPTHRGGWGSPEMSNALMAAGFSLMANKSPWLGQAVGNAGLAGLGTYTEAVRHGEATERQEHKEAREEKKGDLAQSKVDLMMKVMAQRQEASIAATNARSEATKNATRARDLAEQREQRVAAQGNYTSQPATRKNPETGEDESGTMVMNTKTGQTEFRPYTLTAKPKGPPPVARTAEETAEIKKKVDSGEIHPRTAALADKAEMDPVTLKRTAAQYNIVGPQALANLGRGQQSDAKLMAVRTEAARQDDDAGVTPAQRAQLWAEYQGSKSAQRTLGVQEAKMGTAGFEAKGAIALGRKAIELVPRTSIKPLNELVQLWQNKTLSPEQSELFTRTQGIINAYAAVMARGANVTTDSSRHRAEELLSTASNPAVYNRVLDTMESEIDMAIHAPDQMRKFYAERYGAKAVLPEGAAPPAASPAAPTAPPKYEVGKVYESPKGRFRRVEGGWEAAP